MRGIKEGLAWGTLARFLSYACSCVIVFFITPIMITRLGQIGFGFWSLIGSMIGISTFFDLGMSSSLKRFLPFYEVRGDKEKYYQTVVTSLAIFCTCSFMFLMCAFFFQKEIFNKFAQGIPYATFSYVYSIVAIDFATQFPMRVIVGILESKLEYDSLAIVDLGKALIRGAAIYSVLYYGLGLEAVALVCFATNILGHAFLFLHFRRYHWFEIANKQYRLFNSGILLELVSYSWINILASWTDILRFKMDDFVISRFVALGSVTPYAVSMKLINYFVEFISIVMGQTVPVFSKLDAAGNRNTLIIAFTMLTKISTALSVYIGGVLIIFGKFFLDRWIGSAALKAYPVLVLLAIAFVIALSQYPMMNLMRGISKHSILLICNFLEGIANLILSLVLVHYYGILGVAAGTAIPMLINKLFLQPYIFCRVVNIITFGDYYQHTLGPPLVMSILIISVLGALITPYMSATYSTLFIGVTATCPYFVAVYWLCFSKEEKRAYFHPLFELFYAKFSKN